MTATTEEAPAGLYDAGVSEADFGDDEDDAAPPTGPPHVPEGYTVDRDTGEIRLKKKPGRPKTPPRSPEELRAAEPPPQADIDRAPDDDQRRPPPDDAPMPKGGIIAAGVNKLYRRAGKILRAFDHDLGQAVIECTKPDPDDEDWLTVGQAWEQLARDNPRIRRIALKAIAGGAWQDLVMAHAPIGMALIAKPAVRKLIPFGKIFRSLAERDDDDAEGMLPEGLTEDDMRAMAAQAGLDMEKVAARMMKGGLPPDVARVAESMAQSAGSGITPGYVQHDLADGEERLPAGLRRQQPKRQTRATRAKAGAR